MAHPPHDRPRNLFVRGSWLESSRAADILRAETTGGLLLMAAAALAVIWANSPWRHAYERLRDWSAGPGVLDLHLSLAEWSSDGLLAIFFFVAGLELKREFVAGDLRDPRRAALPVAAAIGGMAVPALVYLAVNLAAPTGQTRGWAIPTTTDIAFAVAVLAVISTHLPAGLRTFLLTLAVVDDLLGITIIAVVYTSRLHLGWLVLALVPIAVFGLLVQRRIWNDFLLVPLAVTAWALVHASGVHATVAGVLLAFTVPVRRRDGDPERPGLAEHLEHINRPISTGLAVPVFALLSAGVTIGGWHGLTETLGDPVAIGIVAGLVVGKPLGITAATWLLATFTRARLDDDLTWAEVVGAAMLGGIGFTVSLLIGELAFSDSARSDHVKVGVLLGSVLAALLAALLLRVRNAAYRSTEAADRLERGTDG